MKIITDQHCTLYSAPGHPERPSRITGSVERLRSQTDLPIEWMEPLQPREKSLLRAHTRDHLKRLALPADFDGDTPAYPDIFDHARRSAGGALHALELARNGEPAFSLLRPPGHHATSERAMGFCYLNSIAIAVLEAQATGTGKVAVLDFDVHHGNGTEAILLGRDETLFCSVHQYPGYPGTGSADVKNCRNFIVPPDSPAETYRAACEDALDAIRRFKPELVAVSAGFDAYRGDPLSHQAMEARDFHWLGSAIRELEVPAFGVLEGGYSDDLPELILAWLSGLSGFAHR